MIHAIVYNSNTGFTKQFAYSFAVQTGLPIYSLRQIKQLKAGSNIIYFSWIKASKIEGLNKVKNGFNLAMVCAVGMMAYSIEYIEELKKENNLEEIFYLRGGLRLYKLSIMQRTMIKMVRNSLIKKQKQSKISMEEQELLDWMQVGHENILLDSLEPLIVWFNDRKEVYVS